ncbi:SseB family protein [Parafrigoribacterium mesophilum]
MPVSNTTDSAGQPWAGRSFAHVTASDDDGTAPQEYLAVLDRFHAGDAGADEVVRVLARCRLFVPLVAKLAEATTSNGLASDKRAEMSIVTVAGPDGRNVLPAFTSVAALQRWNPRARPVAQTMRLIALAAADDGTDLVVIDPTSPTEFAVRRPAVWALAQDLPWTPSYGDPEVLAEFVQAAGPEPSVDAVQVAAGDPDARLTGPELALVLQLDDGLGPDELTAVVGRMQQRWASSTVLAERVDSLEIRLVAKGA